MRRPACTFVAALGVLVLTVLTAAPAFAAGPDYTYLELRYIKRNVGVLFNLGGPAANTSLEAQDGRGYAIAGSLLLLRNLYVVGEYTEDIDVDLNGALANATPNTLFPDTLRTRYTRFGVGLRFTLVPGMDAFGEVGWEKNKLNLSTDIDLTLNDGVSISFGGLDEDSVDFKLGLRLAVGQRLELTGYARQTQAQLRDLRIDANGHIQLSDDTVFGFAAAYYLSRRIAIGANYESGDLNSGGAFLRLSF